MSVKHMNVLRLVRANSSLMKLTTFWTASNLHSHSVLGVWGKLVYSELCVYIIIMPRCAYVNGGIQ